MSDTESLRLMWGFLIILISSIPATLIIAGVRWPKEKKRIEIFNQNKYNSFSHFYWSSDVNGVVVVINIVAVGAAIFFGLAYLIGGLFT